MRELYDVLGVKPDASPDDIKAAFRRAAKRTHPDHGGDIVAFRAVNNAYAILTDPEKRAKYEADGTTDTAANNENAAALGLVQQLFEGIIQAMTQGQDPGDDRVGVANDVVQVVRDELDQRIHTIVDNIANTHAMIARLKKIAPRFHAAGEKNVLRQMVEYRISGLERGIPEGARQLQLHQDALKALDGYSFEHDPAPVAQPFAGVGNPLGFKTGPGQQPFVNFYQNR